MRKALTLITSITFSLMAFSQDDCQKAKENFDNALQSIESKQYVLAEQYLKEAIALCPKEEIKYTYELAWNYYLIKENK